MVALMKVSLIGPLIVGPKGGPINEVSLYCDLMLCTTPACFSTFFDLLWSLL